MLLTFENVQECPFLFIKISCSFTFEYPKVYRLFLNKKAKNDYNPLQYCLLYDKMYVYYNEHSAIKKKREDDIWIFQCFSETFLPL